MHTQTPHPTPGTTVLSFACIDWSIEENPFTLFAVKMYSFYSRKKWSLLLFLIRGVAFVDIFELERESDLRMFLVSKHKPRKGSLLMDQIELSHLIHPFKVKEIFFLKWHVHGSTAVTDHNKKTQSTELQQTGFSFPTCFQGEKRQEWGAHLKSR